ncbi:MAG: DUF4928 domain-containing protein [Acidimicrobiales bacterium]|nr:DUF4928 domain-containing protein [Acidimicrobiales bacterium]MYB80808.1 DUF4928 domain-containing protein [Acidimicrobiales bacterium]MYI11098.1 DUF4928 domain-containing protein [Acidimicrobiales bacterium]
MTSGNIAALLGAVIEDWYEAQRTDAGVNRNVMTVGLIMCEHMMDHFPLEESKWFTGTQVSLLGGSRINKILARHDEERTLASEGGRTSRGSQELARSFQAAVNESPAAEAFAAANLQTRADVVDLLQAAMVDRIRTDFFDRQRLRIEYRSHEPTGAVISQLLDAASRRGGNASGAVAQHVVGAALCLHYPNMEIDNHSYTTADEQTGRVGDFILSSAALHVTTAPGEALMRKCEANLARDLFPVVLTLRERIAAAEGLAGNFNIADSISVRDVVEFAADAVDISARYVRSQMAARLRELLDTYNARVAAAEPDPSLQVEIPDNLRA